MWAAPYVDSKRSVTVTYSDFNQEVSRNFTWATRKQTWHDASSTPRCLRRVVRKKGMRPAVTGVLYDLVVRLRCSRADQRASASPPNVFDVLAAAQPRSRRPSARGSGRRLGATLWPARSTSPRARQSGPTTREPDQGARRERLTDRWAVVRVERAARAERDGLDRLHTGTSTDGPGVPGGALAPAETASVALVGFVCWRRSKPRAVWAAVTRMNMHDGPAASHGAGTPSSARAP
jgi:hypothetical protein